MPVSSHMRSDFVVHDKIKYLKINWAGGVTQIVEHLSSKYENLNSIPSTTKKGYTHNLKIIQRKFDEVFLLPDSEE
jgi:hypothetical protein